MRGLLLPWVLAGVLQAAGPTFDVQRLGEGIFAFVRKDPPGLMVDANCLVIVNDADVVVVDAPEASAEVIATLKKLTSKPVRYVINTHWHDDHVLGNHLFAQAYPGVEFIAHTQVRTYLPDRGLAARKAMVEGAPPFVDYIKAQMGKGLNLEGQPLTEEECRSFESDFRLVDQYLSVARIPVPLPTLTVEDKLVLHRGARVIEVLRLGAGHTGGDLVVHLPQEGLVAAGDLVGAPVPLVGAEQSQVGAWIRSLERLEDLRPRRILPGHGPVLTDLTQVRRMAALFRSVQRQVAALGEDTVPDLRRKVNLDAFREEMAGASPVLQGLFKRYVLGPAVEAAHREKALGGTRNQVPGP